MKFPETLSDLLSIEYPIIQAPMAGKITTPELVTAVSNAGGLGSIASGYMTAETLAQTITAVKARTSKPFQVNLFVTQEPMISSDDIKNASTRLANIWGKQQNTFPEFSAEGWRLENFDDLISIVLENDVPIVSFTFGTPDSETIQLLKSHGIKIIGNATHLLEAYLWQDLGVDAIILQGVEAGGHRTTFIGDSLKVAQTTFSLLKQIRRELTIPLIAAGGIMDSSSIAAAFCLGADGVSMGTAFLGTDESGASTAHKKVLINSNELDSVISNEWSGAYGRCVLNKGLELLQKAKGRPAPFPIQSFLLKQLMVEAEKNNDPDFFALYAGVGAQFCQEASAMSLIKSWVSELELR